MKKSFIILIVVGVIILTLGIGWYFINKTIPIDLLLGGGPGGCSGSDCEEFCQNNPEECQKWCEENLEVCQQFMGGGFESSFGKDFFSADVNPPSTEIEFAKTVNFISGQFDKNDITKAKNLGANMITIWPIYRVSNDEFIFYPNAEGVSSMINAAYENGLHVELRNSFGGGRAEDYEKFKANALIYVAEFAKFAEEHKVYRIVPFGEVDNHLIEHCDKITEFSEELLTEMKKHYSGQIGVGIVAPWRDCGYVFNGYDYLTFSAYAQPQLGVDRWLTPNKGADLRNIDNNNLVALTSWAREVADRSNVEVLHLGETGVLNIGESDPTGFGFKTVEITKEKESEFYDIMFLQIRDKVNGVSVFYNSRIDFMSVNGDPAEEVVKDWYLNKF